MVVAVAAGCAAGCGMELEHGLDERQANEVVAALDRAGIAADKSGDDKPGTYQVLIPRADAARAFQVLETGGLPRRSAKGVGEAFAEKGLLPSATAERARLQASLAIDLERTLEALPQVASARVHLALPEEEPLHAGSARQRPTASVLLRTRGATDPFDGEVKRLVAGAVHGLQGVDVSVVISQAMADPAPSELAQVGPLRVSRSSRGLAIGFLTGALGAILLLSLAVMVLAARLATLRQRLRERA